MELQIEIDLAIEWNGVKIFLHMNINQRRNLIYSFLKVSVKPQHITHSQNFFVYLFGLTESQKSQE